MNNDVRSLEKLVAYLFSAYLEAHTVHLNCIGPHFDTAHKVAKKYYEKLFDFYDGFAEKLRSTGTIVYVPKLYGQFDWQSLPVTPPFTWLECVSSQDSFLTQCLEAAYELLKVTDNEGWKNLLGDLIEYLDDEVNFFNAKRWEGAN